MRECHAWTAVESCGQPLVTLRSRTQQLVYSCPSLVGLHALELLLIARHWSEDENGAAAQCVEGEKEVKVKKNYWLKKMMMIHSEMKTVTEK